MNSGTSITAEGGEKYNIHNIRIEEASSLIVAGSIAFLSQAIILFLFNLYAVLNPTLRPLNTQAVWGAELFAVEISLGTFILLAMLHYHLRKSGKGIINAILCLAATLAAMSINAVIQIPLSAGPVGKALGFLLMPFDNFIMGIGLILSLAGSIIFLVHSLRTRRIKLNLHTE